MPRGITAEGLREAGARAEDVDTVIDNLEVVLNTLKQANLIFDGEAYGMLLRLNERVRSARKQNFAFA